MIAKPIVAQNQWNDTGIMLRAGIRYRFGLAEPVDIYDASIHVTTLDGWPFCWQWVLFTPFLRWWRRRPSDPWFALIGTVDRKNPFRIAKDGQEYVSPANGQLVCYVNDLPGKYENNKGSIVLRVTEI